MASINQYVIFSYYDRKKVETLNIEEGVIIIDTKNDVVYENEEINQIISGDIDWRNFIYMNFYLDDDTLYMIEYAYENLSETSEKKRTYIDLYRAKIMDGKMNFERLYSEIER